MKEVNEMTIGEAKARLDAAKKDVQELSALFGQSIEESQASPVMSYPIGERVIIRARDAGVHFGELVSVDGRSVILKNSRRMWRWWSGGKETTLSGVARHGLADRDEVRIAGVVSEISILDACEIIRMTDIAIASLTDVAVANAQ